MLHYITTQITDKFKFKNTRTLVRWSVANVSTLIHYKETINHRINIDSN